MIAVAGEALIDLIVGPDGKVDARPGGGPFNVARTAGRLGLRPAFIGSLSEDGFGKMLRDVLHSDGVQLAIPAPTQAPTTLAVLDIDGTGQPKYRFHLAGTSAAELDHVTVKAALPTDVTALHVGTLGLVMDPIADALVTLIENDLPENVLLMADPNCRPVAITDPGRYRHRLDRVLARADVVKVSTEDLQYLYPDVPAAVAARSVLARGPSLVLLTGGPHPSRALTSDWEFEVPVPPVQVIDTIGAGDAFGGAFLSWWATHNLDVGQLRDPKFVRSAVEFAVEVAALTCTRPGAEPPWASELPERP
jgi:fructokinase